MLKFVVVFWALGGASVLGAGQANDSYQIYVQKECSFTRYPSVCVQTMMGSGLGHVDIMLALANKTISETMLATFEFVNFSSQFKLGGKLGAREPQRVHSVKDYYCEELMNMSLKRLDQSLLALKQSPRKNKHDIQAWLSAALTFQDTCKDYASGQISKRIDNASQLVSNLLALVNRITSNHTTTVTNHRSVDQGLFAKWVSQRDRKLLQATTIKADAVVAKDGSGDYKTVSEAVNAASGGRFVIYVKAGVYEEKIHTKKDGITLIGDGKYSTIITGDDSVAKGASMPGSATFTVTGDGFIARDIGFQNTAGPQGEQALALYISSDRSVLYRCSIVGYQDTLYAYALRQFYRECDIYGTIDFIFGNAAAVFQSCDLVLRRHKGYNAILANGRSDPGQKTGFSVQNCRIIPSSDFSPVKHSYSSYLGRPWKQYSRAIVMESTIDDVIAPQGWVEWPGAGGSSLKTLYFAEYANGGPGAGLGKRVQWPGFHVIGADEAVEFTVSNFIAGTSWLPSTGVTFVSGLH
ncbi:PREDICTED: pectinesterase [Prunus dulcis]|uniref:Pectinesterase n=1 Tax=Prunus dulcis TaxID=3755 RepID=A0A5E4E489_PRUDU|nr:pectinesterase [Prunus dulcis]KAI5320001.1 hypothetical protein L3X38_039709 [Prunus dulcis]VVA10146.1 PREDICTED: pectinesterase [Prunus dulcis]